jgi:hypothetical protein
MQTRSSTWMGIRTHGHADCSLPHRHAHAHAYARTHAHTHRRTHEHVQWRTRTHLLTAHTHKNTTQHNATRTQHTHTLKSYTQRTQHVRRWSVRWLPTREAEPLAAAALHRVCRRLLPAAATPPCRRCGHSCRRRCGRSRRRHRGCQHHQVASWAGAPSEPPRRSHPRVKQRPQAPEARQHCSGFRRGW